MVAVSRTQARQRPHRERYGQRHHGRGSDRGLWRKPSRSLTSKAAVLGPDRRKEKLELEQIGPRRYKGTFELWGRGRYQIMASGDDGQGREENVVGAISVALLKRVSQFQIGSHHFETYRGGNRWTDSFRNRADTVRLQTKSQGDYPKCPRLVPFLACLLDSTRRGSAPGPDRLRRYQGMVGHWQEDGIRRDHERVVAAQEPGERRNRAT